MELEGEVLILDEAAFARGGHWATTCDVANTSHSYSDAQIVIVVVLSRLMVSRVQRIYLPP